MEIFLKPLKQHHYVWVHLEKNLYGFKVGRIILRELCGWVVWNLLWCLFPILWNRFERLRIAYLSRQQVEDLYWLENEWPLLTAAISLLSRIFINSWKPNQLVSTVGTTRWCWNLAVTLRLMSTTAFGRKRPAKGASTPTLKLV